MTSSLATMSSGQEDFQNFETWVTENSFPVDNVSRSIYPDGIKTPDQHPPLYKKLRPYYDLLSRNKRPWFGMRQIISSIPRVGYTISASTSFQN